ncbi:hypothetical protein ERJ75_000540500 [Trypanosoma vivax]|nr:hypothetical protein ERJ75_000540500 [Trypanosoma vivax]
MAPSSCAVVVLLLLCSCGQKAAPSKAEPTQSDVDCAEKARTYVNYIYLALKNISSEVNESINSLRRSIEKFASHGVMMYGATEALDDATDHLKSTSYFLGKADKLLRRLPTVPKASSDNMLNESRALNGTHARCEAPHLEPLSPEVTERNARQNVHRLGDWVDGGVREVTSWVDGYRATSTSDQDEQRRPPSADIKDVGTHLLSAAKFFGKAYLSVRNARNMYEEKTRQLLANAISNCEKQKCLSHEAVKLLGLTSCERSLDSSPTMRNAEGPGNSNSGRANTGGGSEVLIINDYADALFRKGVMDKLTDPDLICMIEGVFLPGSKKGSLWDAIGANLPSILSVSLPLFLIALMVFVIYKKYFSNKNNESNERPTSQCGTGRTEPY